MATPKAKLNQIYNSSDDGQPQYSTFPGASSTFCCRIELPNGVVVVSDPCRRKKDAEQDAARKALQEIGAPFESEASVLGLLKSHEDIRLDLKLRIETAFTNECVLSYKPLMEHFRAAIVRRGKCHAPVPATVLASLDTKIIGMCKTLDQVSDSNPARALELVYSAAKASSLLTCDSNLWISRVEPFPAHIQSELTSGERERIEFDAVYIPSSVEQMIRTIHIVVQPDEYYLDVLARELGIMDGARLLISRSITKSPSGTRLFWGLFDSCDRGAENVRASTLTSYPVYGNAILASVGSTWKSNGKLWYDDVSLGCYYRLILSKYPSGSYKLSRAAPLTAELSSSFTSKSRWRGATPRSILNEFCHQSHLLAPTFYTCSVRGDEPLTEDQDPRDGASDSSAAETSSETSSGDLNSSQGPFICKVRMLLAGEPLEFGSERPYRSRHDAIQSACLRALLHFDGAITLQLSASSGEAPDSEVDAKQPAFEIVSGGEKAGGGGGGGDRPAIGSMVHVDYSVRLLPTGGGGDVIPESHTEFEFELGSGAVLGPLDSCVAGMFVGQTARFCAPLTSPGLLLASEGIHPDMINNLSKGCMLEYTVTLRKCVEAAEARMESAVFSPPLSKQRIDFALQLFQRSKPSSLIDLGCGSGSLLEAIVEQPNTLHRIVGVDFSQRSLTRASKSLQTKLSRLQTTTCVDTLALYEGSIAEPDHLFRGFDIATCLEVVEHMDPDPLSKFGESVMGVMSPKVLLVSTPNIEYNPILHGIVSRKEKGEGCDEAGKVEPEEASSIRLRNDDHRFEWTRAEFNDWASTLARRYGYSVEFSGVGGTPGQEPGFASQMAVFTREQDDSGRFSRAESSTPYSEIWRWASAKL